MSNDKNHKAPSDYQRTSLSFTAKETYMWKYLCNQFNHRYYIKSLIHKDMVERGLVDENNLNNSNNK